VKLISIPSQVEQIYPQLIAYAYANIHHAACVTSIILWDIREETPGNLSFQH